MRVNADVLYVDNGRVLTSAGSAAGIDLCLHIVRRDHGSKVANAVARRLVIPPHRDGGQAQLIELPMPAHPDDDPIAAVMAWALERLDEPLDLDALAGRAYMSVRTFTRRFRKATGTTPGRWLLEQRVRASLALLEGDGRVDRDRGGVGRLRQRGDLPPSLRGDHAHVADAYRRASECGRLQVTQRSIVRRLRGSRRSRGARGRGAGGS